MKSDDTKPTVLSAARLAEIRERVSYTVIAEGHNEAIADRAALLRYLDALAAGPVPDGEALGRMGFSLMNPGDGNRVVWERYDAESRAPWISAGAALYLQGFAAGAVSVSGEGDDPSIAGAILILMQRRDREQHEAHANGRAEGEAAVLAEVNRLLTLEYASASEIAEHVIRLEANDEERIKDEETIARLQAELAEARQALTAMDGEWGAAHDALAAELAEARAALAESEAHAGGMLTLCNVLTAERDAARRDGAREERREWSALLAIVDRITFDAPDDKPNGPGEQAIDDMSKALEVDRWPSNVRSRIADLNGHMATLCDALADDCRDLKAAADALRARGEDRPPCPGAGWEWDAFALQWFQPGAKGKAIAVPNRARGTGGAG